MKTRRGLLVRASISFPPDIYEMLERLAKQKKVSLAWVVREAAEKYVVAEKPLSVYRRKGENRGKSLRRAR